MDLKIYDNLTSKPYKNTYIISFESVENKDIYRIEGSRRAACQSGKEGHCLRRQDQPPRRSQRPRTAPPFQGGRG